MKIAIYGAGYFSRRVWAHYKLNNIEIQNFIVTNKEGNPSEIRGIPVVGVDDIDFDGIEVVIGVTDKFRQEVLSELQKRKVSRIIVPELPPLQKKNYQKANEKEFLDSWYYVVTGDSINWDNLKTYNEKIQWLKLNAITPTISELSDKIAVREYVKKQIGEDYLTQIYGIWKNVDEIDFDILPKSFVLKCNHGCGCNYIVKNKSEIDIDKIRKCFEKWINTDYSDIAGLELQYKMIEPRIYAEEYLENEVDDLYDYKFWCFHGKVEFIMFLSGRNKKMTMNNYDREWNLLPFTYDCGNSVQSIDKPDNLEEMIHVAESLAHDFIHVRVDLYRLNDNRVKFGELTFTSASGVMRWSDKSIAKTLGDKMHLEELNKNKCL